MEQTRIVTIRKVSPEVKEVIHEGPVTWYTIRNKKNGRHLSWYNICTTTMDIDEMRDFRFEQEALNFMKRENISESEWAVYKWTGEFLT